MSGLPHTSAARLLHPPSLSPTLQRLLHTLTAAPAAFTPPCPPSPCLSRSPPPQHHFTPVDAQRRSQHSAAQHGAAQHSTWPVIISGAGPTGLTAAILLSKFGVPSLVLERQLSLTNHPQAHFINMRAMEVFRCLDGLSREVTSLTPPLHQWRKFVYCDTMTGDIMGSVDHFKGQTTPAVPSMGPEPVAHLAQHRLLPLLAHRAAARNADITLRWGHSVRGFRQDAKGVDVRVEGPEGERYSVRGQYMIAADGARGATRSQLGIEMEGPGGIQHLINVHFVSPELGRLLRGREGMLYFVFGTQVIAVVVAHNIDEGEFVAQVPYFPPLQRPEEFTPAACAELVRRVAGLPRLALDVRTIRPWTMSGKVAGSYQRGRVFLAGDAAHHFPPSGAFGMNTGVCDAHNLAWKLAAVVQGGAGEQLLGSYTPERKPVGVANMKLSADNFYEELKVPSAIGLDFSTANLLSGALSSPLLSFIPQGVRSTALNTAFSLGLAASGAVRQLRRQRLQEIFGSGETLRLQFPKEDLGYVYHQEGSAVHRSAEDDFSLRDYLRPRRRQDPYQPCTLPGARFPHFQISVARWGSLGGGNLEPASPKAGTDAAATARDAASDDGHRGVTSPLDLVDAAGTALCLFLSDTAGLPMWLGAAERGTRETGVLVHPVVVVDGEGAAEGLCARLRDHAGGAHVTIAVNADGAWGELGRRGVGERGGVLVRPDGHVGWRGKCEELGDFKREKPPEEDLGRRLAHAVKAVMGL